jgi:hypothetical protein
VSPAAEGRRAPSGCCVVAEGGPNRFRAEIRRSHGTTPLVPMTPASAKPETGRPGGGYHQWAALSPHCHGHKHPAALLVSVLVCLQGVDAYCISFRERRSIDYILTLLSYLLSLSLPLSLSKPSAA